MSLKTLSLAAVAAALLIAAPASLQAQTKIAFVDFQRALLDTADMQSEAAKLEAEFKPQQDRLQALNGELQQIQTRLQSAAAEAAPAIQAEGQRKQREAQRLTEDLQADIDYRREEILQKGAVRMREVLGKLRDENGYTAVMDISATYAFDSSLEITAEAVKAYDAANPVAP